VKSRVAACRLEKSARLFVVLSAEEVAICQQREWWKDKTTVVEFAEERPAEVIGEPSHIACSSGEKRAQSCGIVQSSATPWAMDLGADAMPA
jgi:hypothetical protein